MQVNKVFQSDNEIKEFLMENGLSESEVTLLLNSTLNMAHILLNFGQNLDFKPVTCEPKKLATYLKTDDLVALSFLSESLCKLSNEQIKNLTKMIQTNIDIESLINRGQEVANITLSYNVTSFTQDLTSLVQTLWNLTVFQDMDIPEILQPDLYAEELGALVDSAMNSDNINFTM